MERGKTYLHIGSHELVEATHVTSNLTFQVTLPYIPYVSPKRY